MTVGHSSFTAYPADGTRERIYEQALKKILKARQVSHAKIIAKEALQNCHPGRRVESPFSPGPAVDVGQPGGEGSGEVHP